MGGDFPNLSNAQLSHWPLPDFIDPTTRDWFPVYGITFEIVTTLVVVARLGSSLRQSHVRANLEDGLIIFAWVFSILFTSSCVLGTSRYGFDRHIWDSPRPTFINSALVQWLSEGAFLISMSLTKLSVLLFCHRITTQLFTKAWEISTVFLITCTVAYMLGFLLRLVLLCYPTDSYWKILRLDGISEHRCVEQTISYPLEGGLDALTVLYTIMLPALIFRNIQLNRRQIFGLCSVFAVSLAIVGAGIARAIYLARLANDSVGDATWNGFHVFVVAQLECQLAIICACLPSLRVYIPRMFSTPLGTSVIEHEDAVQRHDSLISRVSSSLSGQIKRSLTIGRPQNHRHFVISDPQVVEIPEWEFEAHAYQSPRPISSPKDLEVYDRYLAGRYGPPPPPKDSRDIFDQYRRDHGQMV